MASEQETRRQKTARILSELEGLTTHLSDKESEVVVPPDLSIAYLDIDRFGDRTRLVARIGRAVASYSFSNSLPIDQQEIEYPAWRERHFSPRPIDNGPVVLFDTQKQGSFCIALNTGELIWGIKSRKQQLIVTSILEPEVLSRMELKVGEPFQFVQKAPTEDDTEEDNLHVKDNTGPIKKILVCSSLDDVKLIEGKFTVNEKLKDESGLSTDQVHALFASGEIDPLYRGFATMLHGTRRGNEGFNTEAVVQARSDELARKLDKAQQIVLQQRMRLK